MCSLCCFPAAACLAVLLLAPVSQARDISTDLAFSHEAVWAEQELAGLASEVRCRGSVTQCAHFSYSSSSNRFCPFTWRVVLFAQSFA